MASRILAVPKPTQTHGSALKHFLFGMAVTFLMAAGFLSVTESSLAQTERLISENARLRLFNAREVRRYKRPVAVPHGTENAEHILGTPATLIAAVWKQENGPPDIETGVLGKTAYFSQFSPIEDWAGLETARTLNIYAWQYIEKHPAVLKEILKHAAVPYTGNTMPDAWHKNVYKLYKEQHGQGRTD